MAGYVLHGEVDPATAGRRATTSSAVCMRCRRGSPTGTRISRTPAAAPRGAGQRGSRSWRTVRDWPVSGQIETLARLAWLRAGDLRLAVVAAVDFAGSSGYRADDQRIAAPPTRVTKYDAAEHVLPADCGKVALRRKSSARSRLALADDRMTNVALVPAASADAPTISTSPSSARPGARPVRQRCCTPRCFTDQDVGRAERPRSDRRPAGHADRGRGSARLAMEGAPSCGVEDLAAMVLMGVCLDHPLRDPLRITPERVSTGARTTAGSALKLDEGVGPAQRWPARGRAPMIEPYRLSSIAVH